MSTKHDSADVITNKIRMSIIKGEFSPGSKLTQEHLAELYGVSRMPIREALKKLEAEGLVYLEPYRGAFVRNVSLESVEENYYLRSRLESMALEQSYFYMDTTDFEVLRALTLKMDQTEDPDEFIESNIQFHHLLIEKCPWPRLKSMVESLWNGYPQQTPNFLKNQMEHSNKDHKKIVFALEQNCPEVASDILSQHISNTGVKLMQFMQEHLEEVDEQ